MKKDVFTICYVVGVVLILLYAIFARDYFFLALSAWFMVDHHLGELKDKLKKTENHSDIKFWNRNGKPLTIIKSNGEVVIRKDTNTKD